MNGPLLAAARFALAFDRANPDRAGQYPEFWKERIERARAAGFPADDDREDRDYWRAVEDEREEIQTPPTTQPPLSTASTVPDEDDPFALTDEDLVQKARLDPMERAGWYTR